MEMNVQSQTEIRNMFFKKPDDYVRRLSPMCVWSRWDYSIVCAVGIYFLYDGHDYFKLKRVYRDKLWASEEF